VHQGGVLVTKEAAWSATLDLEDTKPESTVGAGDAFLAGFMAARERGEPPERRLAAGVSAGSASVLTVTVGTLDLTAYEKFLAQVDVKPVEARDAAKG
jgi:fructose-1-phosphate kinase PfkB-like protein